MCWAGIEAIFQAEHTEDLNERRVLLSIAADECGHAELSWAIHLWAQTQLSDTQNATIEAARNAEMQALQHELSQRPNALADDVGLPGAQPCLDMFHAMQSALA